MSEPTEIEQKTYRRMQQEVIDSYDEELELEFEDRIVPQDAPPLTDKKREADREARRVYFTELFKLQSELVNLQDWIVANGHKMVVLFEGRDAAGKGGVIKRITQRLNPRVCRVAARHSHPWRAGHPADHAGGGTRQIHAIASQAGRRARFSLHLAYPF